MESIKLNNGKEIKMYFLGETGLTMTMARTLSNAANQNSSSIESELYRFVNIGSSFDYNGKTYDYRVNKGLPVDWKDKLMLLSQYRGLQAYLMEQIKKLNHCKEVINNNQFDISALKLEELDSYEFFDSNVKDYLSATEWEEYLMHEAKASSIGKMLENVQRQMKDYERLMEFESVSMKSGEFIPLKKTALMDIDDLTELNNELMGEHKISESKKNFLLSKAEGLLEAAVTDFENKKRTVILANQDKASRNNLKLNEYKTQMLSQIGKLRIVVPKELQEIVDNLKKSLKLDDSKGE